MRKPWTSDKKLITLTLLFLLAEMAWLLMHLQVFPNPFKSKSIKMEKQSAGYVMKVQGNLRKRSLDSLVWENTGVDETLSYYDSVLTLAQSSATLYLKEQTEVYLSENTLVTIEPQNPSADSQIRLKFTRGDLRARSPFASTKIETPDWSLNLTQGSEVSLRQTGKENFEVEVLKGQMQFEKDSSSQALAENQVLKIENNQPLETRHIQGSLHFQGPAYQRIYSPRSQTVVSLAWIGEANQIEIIPLGKDRISKSLEPSQSSDKLYLETGKYTLRLVGTGKISEVKEIEIWQTPALQLLSPSPRDRVPISENILFVWSYLPEAQQYKFILTDLKTGKSVIQKTTDNFYQYQFSSENDIQWKVIGLDSDGFEISSSYANQIFPTKQPLAAPKLKNLEIRVPASKPPGEKPVLKPDKKKYFLQYYFWKLIFPQAQAETDGKESSRIRPHEAVFSWEVVDGAEFYTIEISDTTDFRTPRLSKMVPKTEFIWKHFTPGHYYWRVAAGTSSGRMGVFSEPAKVNLEKISEGSLKSDGVLIRKTIDLDAERPAVETRTEDVIKNVPPTQFDESRFNQKTLLTSDQQRQLKATYLLEWTPLWTGWNLNGEENLKTNLTSSTNGAGHFQTEQLLSKDKSYLIDAFYAPHQWKNLEQAFTDLRLQILFGNQKSALLRGGMMQTVPIIEKTDSGQIEIKSLTTAGPSIYFYWQNSERWKSGHSFSLVAGNQVFALSNQNHFRYQIYKDETSVSVGFRFQEDLVFYQRSFSSGWSAGFSFGFDH